MRKLFSIFTLAFLFLCSSCIEQNYPIWEGQVVEFQDAVERAPVAGQVYPRITVANTIGTVTLRVNLVGAQLPVDETVNYIVVPSGSTAVAGVDYQTAGSLTIPKGSSFGNLTVSVVNTGRLGGSRDLLLQIIGSDKMRVSPNYDRVQIRITR
jgi:hypothetical protein